MGKKTIAKASNKNNIHITIHNGEKKPRRRRAAKKGGGRGNSGGHSSFTPIVSGGSIPQFQHTNKPEYNTNSYLQAGTIPLSAQNTPNIRNFESEYGKGNLPAPLYKKPVSFSAIQELVRNPVETRAPVTNLEPPIVREHPSNIPLLTVRSTHRINPVQPAQETAFETQQPTSAPKIIHDAENAANLPPAGLVQNAVNIIESNSPKKVSADSGAGVSIANVEVSGVNPVTRRSRKIPPPPEDETKFKDEKSRIAGMKLVAQGMPFEHIDISGRRKHFGVNVHKDRGAAVAKL